LASLVARDADLWLLDEPHAALDDDGRDLVDGVVRAAVAGGATVVMASHDTDRATALADRVLTVAGGTVTAESSKERTRVP
jgi:energy-coupling factor transporter ATP-binding protein EcfA2